MLKSPNLTLVNVPLFANWVSASVIKLGQGHMEYDNIRIRSEEEAGTYVRTEAESSMRRRTPGGPAATSSEETGQDQTPCRSP